MQHLAVLNEKVSLSGQIYPEEIAEIVKLGYTQLICNRPDGEEEGQPSIDSIQVEAEKHGITLIYAPVANGQFTEDVLNDTQKGLDNDKKTLIFCRSGSRSSILWAIIQVRLGESPVDVFEQVANIGYDINHMEAFVLNIAKI